MSGPFGIVPAEVATDRKLSFDAVRVFLGLACYANADRICWPSQNSLLRFTGLTRYRIRRAIKELLDRGYVQATHRHQPNYAWTSTSYLLFPFQSYPARTTPLAESPYDASQGPGWDDEASEPSLVGVRLDAAKLGGGREELSPLTDQGTNHLTDHEEHKTGDVFPKVRHFTEFLKENPDLDESGTPQ